MIPPDGSDTRLLRLAVGARHDDPVSDDPYGRRNVMAGKYELFTDAGGKYRFRLKAGNGQVIASSEAYESKASALNGIASVKSNAASETVDLT
jgi:uncharacterized protein YegP (UPF0339 family)